MDVVMLWWAEVCQIGMFFLETWPSEAKSAKEPLQIDSSAWTHPNQSREEGPGTADLAKSCSWRVRTP